MVEVGILQTHHCKTGWVIADGHPFRCFGSSFWTLLCVKWRLHDASQTLAAENGTRVFGICPMPMLLCFLDNFPWCVEHVFVVFLSISDPA